MFDRAMDGWRIHLRSIARRADISRRRAIDEKYIDCRIDDVVMHYLIGGAEIIVLFRLKYARRDCAR
jgi:hypothetical protein